MHGQQNIKKISKNCLGSQLVTSAAAHGVEIEKKDYFYRTFILPYCVTNLRTFSQLTN